LSLHIDADVLAASVHGESNSEGALACSDCHINQRYPHEQLTAKTLREFRLERYPSCQGCHEEQYGHAQDSVHGIALREGQLEAATCVDCHGSHDIQPPDEPRQRISLTCGQCHGAIFDEYQKSVHGDALLTEGSPDVPTCIDCHGVHDIQDPTTALFRTRSPELCATCHADTELMEKYDISTEVFDTYLSDFHGTTVALFEQEDPEIASNKAVCYDCHGVHNITPADNSKSQVAKENLLVTCQQCHPNATTDFPDAWVGHFKPTAEDNPVLFGVNVFYSILIPAVAGGFALLVATDIFGRIRRRLGFGAAHRPADADSSEEEEN
ncbi:MAG TPA: cytochrome c3 family protein, partial [Aggregatilineales bacterium]|nr:cytochrome c3 family protein [Aggregatilineales bacterium]